MFSCYIAGAKLRGNVFLPAFPPCFFAIGASGTGLVALSGPYAGRRNHSAPSKAKCLLAAGILLLPATNIPLPTWWSKPDLDREYVLSLDVEHYSEIYKDEEHLETDRQILWVTYYRNLYNATHPSEINSPYLSPGTS